MGRPKAGLRLRKRSDGLFEVVGPHPSSGATLRVQTGSRDAVEAQKFFDQFQAGLATAAVMAPSPKPLLKELLRAYETNREVASKATHRQNIGHLVRHLGNLEPCHVNNEIAKSYVKKRRPESWTTPGRGSVVVGIADSTIRRELNSLRAAIKWAWKQDKHGWFRGDPLPEFQMPVTSKSGVRERWLTKNEAKKLLEAATTPHIRLFIQISLETAARKEAVESLKWDYVDLDTGFIDFGAAVGNKRRPRQKLSDRLLRELRYAHELSSTDYVLEWCGEPCGDIKIAFKKTAIRAKFVTGKRIDRHGKVVEVTDVTPHILKHTSISWMVQSGDMTYEEIAKFADTSAKMIEDVYGKMHPKTYLKAHAATAF